MNAQKLRDRVVEVAVAKEMRAKLQPCVICGREIIRPLLVCSGCDLAAAPRQNHCGNPRPESAEDFPEDLVVSRFSPPYSPDYLRRQK